MNAYVWSVDATSGQMTRMDEGDMYRASGDCVCETCGKLYYDHPYFTEPYEFLTISGTS